MLDNLSIREKKLVFFTLSLILIISLYFVLINPLMTRLVFCREQIQLTAIKLSKYQKIIQNKSLIENTYTQFLELIKGEGTTQDENSKFLQEVDQLCQKAGVRILNVKPLGLQETRPLNKIRIEVEIECPQAALGKMLYELKISPYIIHTDTLRMTTGIHGNSIKCLFILSRVIE